MSGSRVLLVVHEDGETLDQLRHGNSVPSDDGTELRAFYRRMELGGKAADHVERTEAKVERLSASEGGELAATHSGVYRVLDYAHNRTYLVSGGMRDITDILAAPDEDPPVLASDEEIELNRQPGPGGRWDETVGYAPAIQGWGSRGDEVPMTTVEEIADQRRDSDFFHKRVADDAERPKLAVPKIPNGTEESRVKLCNRPTRGGGRCRKPVPTMGARCAAHR